MIGKQSQTKEGLIGFCLVASIVLSLNNGYWNVRKRFIRKGYEQTRCQGNVRLGDGDSSTLAK